MGCFVYICRNTKPFGIMEFEVIRKDNYSIVQVNVEKLDSLIAPVLKSELVVLNNDGIANVILDLSRTRYCDSSGLSSILVGNRLCKNVGGRLVLTGLQEAVKKLIVISQLDSILSITDNLSEAEIKLS